MADLTGQRIDSTYDGLIKTNDELPINATLKRLQDGVGNDLPVEVSTGGMKYYGTQDFSNAVVTGAGYSYDLSGAANGDDYNIVLTGSDASEDIVTLTAGNNVSLTPNGSGVVVSTTSGNFTALNSGFLSYTGTISDYVLASIRIPGGTFQFGDIIQIKGSVSTAYETTPGTQSTLEMWIGDSGTYSTADTLISTMVAAGSYNMWVIDRTLFSIGTATPAYTNKTVFGIASQYPTLGVLASAPPNDWSQNQNSSNIAGRFIGTTVNPLYLIIADINWTTTKYLKFAIQHYNGNPTTDIFNLQICKING